MGAYELHLTHAWGINAFDEVICHLEIEEESLASLSVKEEANLASSSSNCKFNTKVTNTSYKGEKKKTIQVQFYKKKSSLRQFIVANLLCYKCRKKGF